MNCFPHWEFGMPRFQCLSCSKTTFINDRRVFKVKSVILRPGMICNPKAFCHCFDIFGVENWPFLHCSTTNNWHKKFCTWRLSPNPGKVETSGPGTVAVG